MRAVEYRGVNDLRLETVTVPRIRPHELRVKVPARNSFLEGAMLEPVNTVLKAINRLALLRGDSVLVIGQGPIGLMFTRLLALRGLKVSASDLLSARLKLARVFGARRTFRGDDERFPNDIKRLSRDGGLDAVVVAVPSDEAVR